MGLFDSIFFRNRLNSQCLEIDTQSYRTNHHFEFCQNTGYNVAALHANLFFILFFSIIALTTIFPINGKRHTFYTIRTRVQVVIIVFPSHPL